MAGKTKVLVSVLSGESMMHASLGMMTFRLPYLSGQEDHPFYYGLHIEPGVRPQEYARNIICGEFLKGPAEIMVQIDDDMIVDADTVGRLCATPGDWDICAPMMFMFWPANMEEQKPPRVFACAGRFDPERADKIQPISVVAGADSVEVDWVGSGMIAIKRHVLEDPRMHLKPGCNPPAIWRNVYEANGVRKHGLDIDLCRRAKALGYKIRVNWAAEIGHFKRVDLNQMELYKQIGFQQGAAIGEHRAIQMAQEQSGQKAGDNGVAPGHASGPGVAGERMDRTAGGSPG